MGRKFGKNSSCWQTAWFVTCIAACLTLTDGVSREDDETRLAMDEVGRLFRRMFPLVPDKAQYFWKSSHLGGTLLLRNPQERTAMVQKDSPAVGDVRLQGGTSPWRLELQFRKRGPDCMRKCIAQGVLHPVQCHSLC